MFRPGTLLLAAAAAQPRFGCAPPRARVTIEAVQASRPTLAWARCLTVGLKPPVTFAWKVPLELKTIGWNAPQTEGALLLQVPDAPKHSSRLRCAATDGSGASVIATAVYGPLVVTKVAPGEGTLTVEGSGFGPPPAPDERGEDGVYLVPPRGPAILAVQACPAATWGDEKIVACMPPGVKGTFALRVASGGRLAQAPSPLTVGEAHVSRGARLLTAPSAPPTSVGAKPLTAPSAPPTSVGAKPLTAPSAPPTSVGAP